MNLNLRKLIFPVFVSVLPAIYAAAGGPPPVTVQGEVSVKGPVEVQGVVEVINDVLHQRYMARGLALIPANGLSATVNLDIPAGKRLITRVVSFNVLHPPAEGIRVSVRMPEAITPTSVSYQPLYLSIQSSTPFGERISSVGTHPIALSIDGRPDGHISSTGELTLTLDRYAIGGTNTSIDVNVTGYLVDIP